MRAGVYALEMEQAISIGDHIASRLHVEPNARHARAVLDGSRPGLIWATGRFGDPADYGEVRIQEILSNLHGGFGGV